MFLSTVNEASDESASQSKRLRTDIEWQQASDIIAPLPATLSQFLAELSRNCQLHSTLQIPTHSSATERLTPEAHPVPPSGVPPNSSDAEVGKYRRKIVKLQNLPDDVEEADFVRTLQHQCYFGNVSYVELMQETGSAYVEFENGAAAAKCLRFASNKNNCVTVKGKTVRILATNKSGLARRSEVESEEPTKILFLQVRNLAEHKKIDARDIHGVCAEAELTESLVRVAIDHISSSRDEIFLEFGSISEAIRAKYTLNAQDIFPDLPAGNRCTIRAEFANMDEVDIPQIDDDHFDFTLVPPLNSLFTDSIADSFMLMEQEEESDPDDDLAEAANVILPLERIADAPGRPPAPEPAVDCHELLDDPVDDPQVAAASTVAFSKPDLLTPTKPDSAASATTFSNSHESSDLSLRKKSDPSQEKPVRLPRRSNGSGKSHVTHSGRCKTSKRPISERDIRSPYPSHAANICRRRFNYRDSAFAVLEVSGIDSRRFNCDHVFNLFSLYGNVCKIIFHRPRTGTVFNKAKVQMGDVASASRVVEQLDNVTVFHTELRIRHSTVDFVLLPSCGQYKLPDAKSSSSFKDYANSSLNRFRCSADFRNRISSPGPSLFFVAPKGTNDEKIRKVLRSLDSPSPAQIEFLPEAALPPGERATFVAGTLEFRSKNKAVDALVLANGTIMESLDGQKYPLRLSFLDDNADKVDLRQRLSQKKRDSKEVDRAKISSIVAKAFAYFGT